MTAAVKSCGCCHHHAHCLIDANSGGTTEKTRDLIQPRYGPPPPMLGLHQTLRYAARKLSWSHPMYHHVKKLMYTVKSESQMWRTPLLWMAALLSIVGLVG